MATFFSWLEQVVTVTWFNLQNLRQRLGSSAATVFGVAGVVLVFVGLLSIATGFYRTLASTGDPANALVMRSGADSEMTSGIGSEDARVISDAPQVAAASSELYVIVDLPARATGTEANVPLRGVEPAAFEVRRKVEIVEGRRFEPGRQEIIVGEAAATQYAGLEVGSTLVLGRNEWRVVGRFSTGGTVEDTELWTDVKVLQPAYRRGSTFQSVHARLGSPESFDDFKATLEDDPRLNVKVVRESEYYADQSRIMTTLIKTIGFVIGILMGIGAVFGALNTMYSAVSARTREIATLRALGFGNGPVVISVLAESVLLAVAGGLLGTGLAYYLFNGFRAATLNFQTFSQVAFSFAVTPELIRWGLLYAAVMGFVGGFFPAIRAARLPVATALREL